MKKKLSLGSWLTIPHQYVLEVLLIEKKIKWIVIDMEHTSISISDIEKLIPIIHSSKKKFTYAYLRFPLMKLKKH